jgi:hypothetical protein
MPSSAQSVTFSGLSAPSAAFTLLGGRFVMTAVATFGGGNVQVQQLAADNATWVAPQNLAGSTNNLTAAGSQTMDLPPGTFRINVVTATAVIVGLTSIPD